MAPTELKTIPSLLLQMVRLAVAIVFVSAALPKIQSTGDFFIAIMNYRVTGPTLSAWIALILPWLELTAALGLLIKPLRRASGLVLVGLLLLFMAMHAQAWARGLEIACGCFGSHLSEEAAPTNYPLLLARNGLLIALCWPILHKDFTQQAE